MPQTVYEVVHVEWSDYGDVITVMDHCPAGSEEEAVLTFRGRGILVGYVREAGTNPLHVGRDVSEPVRPRGPSN